MAKSDQVHYIDIDGSVLEGGGQILRMAMVFSALLEKPIRVSKIRAGREKPGLRPQHLTGLQLVRDICHGTLEGDRVGSTEITFRPGKITGGKYLADTKTAGSICLLIQVSLPCLAFADGPCEIDMKGGTNADFAPQIDYTIQVFLPMAEQLGVPFTCDVVRRGYYPRGGGEVCLKVQPISHVIPVNLTQRGHVVRVTGRSWVAGALPAKLAHAMTSSASEILYRQLPGAHIQIESIKEAENMAIGNGNGVLLVAHTSDGQRIASDSLGKKGVAAEKVGADAANELLRNLQHGGCVDDWMQDQLIVFMALATGVSKVLTGPLTLHTKTAIHIAELLTKAKFIVHDQQTSCLVECNGIGFHSLATAKS